MKMKKIQLWQQIVIASVIAIIVGLTNKKLGVEAKILGDLFLRLLQLTIIPLVFPLIVLGIARMKTGKAVGRLALKTLIYFEVITTLLLVMSVSLVNIFHTGIGDKAVGADPANIARFAGKSIEWSQFLFVIVPKNIFAAFSEGNLLPVIFVGALIGIGLGALGERGQPLKDVLESLSLTMFTVIRYVIALSPIGVFGFVAFTTASYGWSKILAVTDLIFVIYLGLAITVLVVFPIVAKIFGVRYWQLIKQIKDLLLIAASTRSSECVLSPCMERLERYGVKNSVVSLVLPLGYSFNLDGGSVYWAPAILFIGNAFGHGLTLGQQVQLVFTLMILSKGIAGVAGAPLIVLASVTEMFGLPLEGLALVFAVDFITDIGRTTTNVIGNALATVAMAKSEGMFEEQNVPGTSAAVAS
jgi:proton glutamate symport protein